MIAAPPPAIVAPSPPSSAPAAYLTQIRWTPAVGGRAPLVAVLDTGVDPNAPALAGAVVADRARSFAPESPDPLVDGEGHGTHVASAIARVAAGRGRQGVRILPVTIAAPDGTTTPGSLARGVRYAAAQGARVINISFGGEGFSRVEQNAINAASRSGALVVVAAGNNGRTGGPPEFPGAYTQVMAVAALGANGRALALSSRGPQIALAAPGEDIAVPRAGGGTESRTGTSMAAAVVSGVAARIIARRPGLSAAQVRTVLETTTVDVPPRGRDVSTGLGAVNLRGALAVRRPPREDAEPNDDTALAAGLPPLLGEGGPNAAAVDGRTGSWGDPRDGFRVYLRAGELLDARLRGPAQSDFDLVVWRVGTPAGERTRAFGARWVAGASLGPTSKERLTLVATRAGYYTVEVQGGRAPGAYRLAVRRRAG